MSKGSWTANRVAMGSTILAVILVGILVLQSYLAVRGILASPSTMRGEFVAALGPLLMTLASALLVRRDSGRRWRSALALGLLAGLIAYSLAAVGIFALGAYESMWASLGPLLVGASFSISGLVALAPSIVYVRYVDEPRLAIPVALTAAVFLSQVAILVAPVLAVLMYWRRESVRLLSI